MALIESLKAFYKDSVEDINKLNDADSVLEVLRAKYGNYKGSNVEEFFKELVVNGVKPSSGDGGSSLGIINMAKVTISMSGNVPEEVNIPLLSIGDSNEDDKSYPYYTFVASGFEFEDENGEKGLGTRYYLTSSSPTTVNFYYVTSEEIPTNSFAIYTGNIDTITILEGDAIYDVGNQAVIVNGDCSIDIKFSKAL